MNESIREVITIDRSSGTAHKRIRVDGRLVVDERCNLDQAGKYDVAVSPADVRIKSHCGHCFPAESSEQDSPAEGEAPPEPS